MRHKLLTVEELKIEKGVPLPEKSSRGRPAYWKNLAKAMKVGDSVFLRIKNSAFKASALSTILRGLYGSKSSAIRKEGKFKRVWRLK